MLFAWLAELLRWSPKFYAMMDYLLNEWTTTTSALLYLALE
jgi:hypothetical protein